MHPGSQITQVYLCRAPIDVRKSIDGLSVLVEQELQLNVFVNRHRNKIKAQYWHRNGFCLWQKRLEADKFAWPSDGEAVTQEVCLQEFEWLMEGFDLWRNKPHKTLDFASVS